MICMIATSQTILPCLHDLGIHQMEAQFPGYQDAANKTFEDAKNSVSPRINDIYTIPVVVHVVWKESEENIPMDQIEDQIAELNRCYRRQNPDTSNMRPIFDDIASDPMIEFELVDVVRVETAAEFQPEFSFVGSGMPDHVKETVNGGSDAFDTNHFMNIWVCRIQPLSILGTESPVLGYAYPPVGLSNWPDGSAAPSRELEGVVVDFRTFGKGLTYEIPQIGSLPMEGRTTVHEVGHYLGLRHISGDGISGVLLGTPDCDADDGLNDTPNQGLQSQFNCDPTQNTCTDASNDRPDMIENYMDYSLETCQNTFTKEQTAIMRAVLEGPRSGLLDGASSTNDLALKADVRVYPNPFSDVVSIKISSEENFINYRLTDFLGKVIRTGNLTTDNVELDFSDLTKGIYNFTISTENGGMVTERMIKQ